MKKSFIAFAIYFGCVLIAAALDMLGLPIIPEDVEVSPVLTLVTHLPAWLYLWFSATDEIPALITLGFEMLSRVMLGFMTVSIFNVAGWLLLVAWLGDRGERKKQRCDLKKDGEPCEFCSFRIAQNNLKESVNAEMLKDKVDEAFCEEGEDDA